MTKLIGIAYHKDKCIIGILQDRKILCEIQRDGELKIVQIFLMV